MHIADGIISTEICVAAHAVSLTTVYTLGRRIETEEVTRMGLLSAVAFVVSLIHFPVAGTSVHLGLLGLLGILLGRRAFPVIFATLLFQALLFQHGGLLSLGLNSFNMGLGALLGWAVWSLPRLPDSIKGFTAGFGGILVPALMMAAEFSVSGYGKGFYYISMVYSVAAVIEGLLTVFIISFFRRVKPEILVQAAA